MLIAEANALQQFYGHAAPSGGPCAYPGVTCVGEHVSNIEFHAATGCVDVLSALTKLQVLDVSLSRVTGNINSLSNISPLQVLSVTNTQVTGNIDSFNNSELVVLAVSGTKVSGNINSLSENVHLQGLFVSNLEVAGSIDSLSQNRLLSVLDVTNTMVSGNIGSLSSSRQLVMLYMSSTEVSGDIGSLSGNSQLENIDVSGTKVSGSIDSFSNFSLLKSLIVANTGVTGNVNSLSKNSELLVLDVSSTKVFGNIQSLSQHRGLRKLDVSNSRVSGDISHRVAVALSKLRFFRAVNAAVKINGISRAEVSPDEPPFASLVQLDVSRSKQNCDVGEWLAVMSFSSKLSAIRADNASLHGTLPNLETLDTVVRGARFIYSQVPLSLSLQHLDLKNNLITTARRPSSQLLYLDLSGNKDLTTVDEALVTLRGDSTINLELTRLNMSNMFARGILQRDNVTVKTSLDGAYRCHEIYQGNLKVTAETFAPTYLCECSVGFFWDRHKMPSVRDQHL